MTTHLKGSSGALQLWGWQ